MQRPRVLLGDDHVIFTDGLRSILNAHFEIVGTAENGKQVVAAAQRLHPDVIVLDISMPLMNGIKAARAVKETTPSAKIVFCTMLKDPAFVAEAFNSGATGYVLKSAAGSELFSAISEVLQGRTYISERMRGGVLGRPPGQRQDPPPDGRFLQRSERVNRRSHTRS